MLCMFILGFLLLCFAISKFLVSFFIPEDPMLKGTCCEDGEERTEVKCELMLFIYSPCSLLVTTPEPQRTFPCRDLEGTVSTNV